MAYAELDRSRLSANERTNLADLGVSVVICCHNSSARLPETLAHLARQKVASDVRWEVLVVDNASTDGTAQVAEQLWPKPSPAPLRVVAEPRPGQAHARLRALAEARYEFLSFIDDDNWVCQDWVQIVHSEMLAHADVGVLGASSCPALEVAPPDWFDGFKFLYAITPDVWQAGDFTHRPGAIWGAGMAVRKSAWLRVRECDCPQLLTGRLKGSMAAGEDIELCYQLRLAGWKLWYEPRLHFQHFLPAGRLCWDYAGRLLYGNGEAGARLGPYQLSLDLFDERPRDPYKYGWLWTLLGAVRELLRHPLALLATWLYPKEGDPRVLTLARLRGQIRMLIRLRATYKSHLWEIQRFSQRVRGRGASENSDRKSSPASADSEGRKAHAVPSIR